MGISRALAVAALLFGSVPALHAQETQVILDESLVYYGNPLDFRTPAVLDVKQVFEHIPEYQRIIDEGMTPKHADYWRLLDQTNVKFQNVLEVVAAEQGLDLVCGSLEYTDGREVLDITELVIEALDLE